MLFTDEFYSTGQPADDSQRQRRRARLRHAMEDDWCRRTNNSLLEFGSERTPVHADNRIYTLLEMFYDFRCCIADSVDKSSLLLIGRAEWRCRNSKFISLQITVKDETSAWRHSAASGVSFSGIRRCAYADEVWHAIVTSYCVISADSTYRENILHMFNWRCTV